MKLHFITAAFVLFLAYHSAHSQPSRNVTWSTRVEKISMHEARLVITARIQPGWHLYTQHLKEGGPQPTSISLLPNEQFTISGFTEQGNPHTYYDDIYEMDITWYSDKVDFVGYLNLLEPVMQLAGRIEYMTCDLHMCVPEKADIIFPVDLTKQQP